MGHPLQLLVPCRQVDRPSGYVLSQISATSSWIQNADLQMPSGLCPPLQSSTCCCATGWTLPDRNGGLFCLWNLLRKLRTPQKHRSTAVCCFCAVNCDSSNSRQSGHLTTFPHLSFHISRRRVGRTGWYLAPLLLCTATDAEENLFVCKFHVRLGCRSACCSMKSPPSLPLHIH